MKYLKNTELAEMYKVSEDTITNWVKAARQKKINLQVVEEGKRTYVVNNSNNHMVMKALSVKAKKYKNRRALKIVYPTDEFYKVFDEKKIIDIIINLDVYKDIPNKYSYFNGGAKSWSLYTDRLLRGKNPNTLTNTIELLDSNFGYISSLVDKFDKVNVVDIGPGNGTTVRNLIEGLLSTGKLNRYIGLDYSPDMLDIARNNFTQWFGESFPFEARIMDMNYDRFQDTLFLNSQRGYGESCVNIVALFGGTVSNQRLMHQPFDVINNSLGRDDIFLYSRKLDTENSRRYFEFESSTTNIDAIEQEKNILNSLNIIEEYYDVNQYYSEELNSRFAEIRLKVDLEIRFETSAFKRKVSLSSGDKITLWRSQHQGYTEVVNQIDRCGFDVLHASRSHDQEQLLVISKIKAV